MNQVEESTSHQWVNEFTNQVAVKKIVCGGRGGYKCDLENTVSIHDWSPTINLYLHIQGQY